jgi:hypothetical protein
MPCKICKLQNDSLRLICLDCANNRLVNYNDANTFLHLNETELDSLAQIMWRRFSEKSVFDLFNKIYLKLPDDSPRKTVMARTKKYVDNIKVTSGLMKELVRLRCDDINNCLHKFLYKINNVPDKNFINSLILKHLRTDDYANVIAMKVYVEIENKLY